MYKIILIFKKNLLNAYLEKKFIALEIFDIYKYSK